MELHIHWHIHLKVYCPNFTLNALWLCRYLFATINTLDIHENKYREKYDVKEISPNDMG